MSKPYVEQSSSAGESLQEAWLKNGSYRSHHLIQHNAQVSIRLTFLVFAQADTWRSLPFESHNKTCHLVVIVFIKAVALYQPFHPYSRTKTVDSGTGYAELASLDANFSFRSHTMLFDIPFFPCRIFDPGACQTTSTRTCFMQRILRPSFRFFHFSFPSNIQSS